MSRFAHFDRLASPQSASDQLYHSAASLKNPQRAIRTDYCTLLPRTNPDIYDHSVWDAEGFPWSVTTHDGSVVGSPISLGLAEKWLQEQTSKWSVSEPLSLLAAYNAVFSV